MGSAPLIQASLLSCDLDSHKLFLTTLLDSVTVRYFCAHSFYVLEFYHSVDLKSTPQQTIRLLVQLFAAVDIKLLSVDLCKHVKDQTSSSDQGAAMLLFVALNP